MHIFKMTFNESYETTNANEMSRIEQCGDMRMIQRKRRDTKKEESEENRKRGGGAHQQSSSSCKNLSRGAG